MMKFLQHSDIKMFRYHNNCAYLTLRYLAVWDLYVWTYVVHTTRLFSTSVIVLTPYLQ
jgi:hypothetical protein